MMRRRTRLAIVPAIVSSAALILGPLACRSRGGLQASIREVEAGRQTTPLVEQQMAGGGVSVTFLARADDGGRAPRIVSDVTGWGEHIDGTFDFSIGAMTRVGGTQWYSLRADVAPRARIEYMVAYGPGDYRLDPHNPRQSASPERGGIRASEFVTPGYAPPQEFTDPPVPAAGAIAETTLESTLLRESCRVIVYTPHAYENVRSYPVAVFLDLRAKQISRVLDWMIARREIEPLLAVFVGPTARGSNGCSTGARMPRFLNEELLSWVAARYHVTTDAARRAVFAVSYGARDALDAAFYPKGSFEGVGVLIPGRRLRTSDIDALAARRDRHPRVAILAGQYDRANLPTARALRDALVAREHRVEYIEVPEGHSASTWSNHLRPVVACLFRQ